MEVDSQNLAKSLEKLNLRDEKDQNISNKENIGELIACNKNGSSLQESFKNFKKKRIEQAKKTKELQLLKSEERQSCEYRKALRQKFIDQAKKYFGVPYAQHYFTPEEAHYNAPLFLDCCALIRRIIWDLQEDFGFKLGRWNQGYQIDTLPVDLKFEEMQPGDLIFYSATYYDQTRRKQPHDMVHVEIFMGGETGEQSIGARWHKGVVQVFDSYKFVSTSYYDIKFHYKSLEPWLEGKCESSCKLHNWKDDSSLKWTSEKFSVFAEEDAEGNEPADWEKN